MSSQNAHGVAARMLSTTGGGGGTGAVVGMLGHNSSGTTNNNTNNMNHTNSSQSVSWSQSTGGSNQKIISSLANHQHGAAPGTPTGADYEAKATAPPSPGSRSSSSSQGGTTLKEHDLLGLSDVSSSSAAVRQENSAQNSNFQSEELNLNLNLGATELRLGPQDGRRKMVLDSGSGFQYQRSGNTVAEQDSCPASETFLGGLDGVGMGSSVVTDRRSSNVDHNAANPEQQQGMEGGLSYSSLTTVGGEREQHPGTTPQGSRSDGVVEGTACRPLIESESLQKWHGGLDRNVSNNENLRLGMSLVQTKRGSNQEDMVEKKLFLNSGERSYQEKAQEGSNQQQLVSDDHHHLHPSSAYQERSWQERNQLNGVNQEDVSSADKGGGGAPELQMSERVVAPQEQQGIEKSEQQQQLKHEAFQVEKRNLSEGGKALPALQLPEPRFVQDNMSSAAAAERSPMQADYVVQQKLWQSQLLMRSAPEFQQSPQQEESSRNGFPGGFPGSRMVFAPSTKPGVTGAKRPFDTIGTPSDARNFNDARSGLPSPVAGNNSSVINSNISLSEADAKSKAAQPPLYQPWSSKATPTWQMLQHSGGSFGPFPSQTPGGRNTAMPPAMTSSTVEGGASSTGGGVDPAQKAWEAHSKSLQQESAAAAAAASLGQKMSSSSSVGPSDANPGPAQSPNTATEAASAPRAAAAPAVGWPPLRSFRKSTIASQPRPSPVVETQSRPPPPPPPQAASPASVASPPNSWFVKVYMDGVPIGRKVDLKTNSSYEKLSLVLEDMFRGFVNGQQTSHREMPPLPSDKRSFLHGSDYVLTYEDQDGDLMLVGDVPWTMFIDTVKRLRIMKGSEAIGLGTRAAEKVSKVQPTV